MSISLHFREMHESALYWQPEYQSNIESAEEIAHRWKKAQGLTRCTGRVADAITASKEHKVLEGMCRGKGIVLFAGKAEVRVTSMRSNRDRTGGGDIYEASEN